MNYCESGCLFVFRFWWEFCRFFPFEMIFNIFVLNFSIRTVIGWENASTDKQTPLIFFIHPCWACGCGMINPSIHVGAHSLELGRDDEGSRSIEPHEKTISYSRLSPSVPVGSLQPGRLDEVWMIVDEKVGGSLWSRYLYKHHLANRLWYTSGIWCHCGNSQMAFLINIVIPSYIQFIHFWYIFFILTFLWWVIVVDDWNWDEILLSKK